MVPGPGPCSCHSPHLAISSLASLCFLVYKLGFTTWFLWDQILMEEKSLGARSDIHTAGSKDKEALSSQVSSIPEGCTSCLLFHGAIHEEKWYPALPQDPLFLPFLLPFVPFSSSPPSHSPSAFPLPIWNLLHWTWYYNDSCPGSVSHLWEHTFIMRKSLVWFICRATL